MARLGKVRGLHVNSIAIDKNISRLEQTYPNIPTLNACTSVRGIAQESLQRPEAWSVLHIVTKTSTKKQDVRFEEFNLLAEAGVFGIKYVVLDCERNIV